MVQSLEEKRRKHTEYMRDWRANNREHNLAYRREYYQKHREHIRKLARKLRIEKNEEINKVRRKHYDENIEKFRAYDRERYRKNKEKILERNRRCFERHREQYLAKKREYNHNHLEEMRDWRKRNLDHLIDYNRMKRGNCKPYQFARKEQCVLCPMINNQSVELYGRRLDVHHVDGNLMNNSVENLLTLCRKCHPRVETIKPLILVVE